MVVDWEQETGFLMTSGDVRVVRIWDTNREMKVQVLGPPHCFVFLFISFIKSGKRMTRGQMEKMLWFVSVKCDSLLPSF